MEFQATYLLFQLHLQYVIFGPKKRLLEFGLQPTEPKSKFLSLHALNYFVKMGVTSVWFNFLITK
jgi:hypothetical protein